MVDAPVERRRGRRRRRAAVQTAFEDEQAAKDEPAPPAVAEPAAARGRYVGRQVGPRAVCTAPAGVRRGWPGARHQALDDAREYQTAARKRQGGARAPERLYQGHARASGHVRTPAVLIILSFTYLRTSRTLLFQSYCCMHPVVHCFFSFLLHL